MSAVCLQYHYLFKAVPDEALYGDPGAPGISPLVGLIIAITAALPFPVESDLLIWKQKVKLYNNNNID